MDELAKLSGQKEADTQNQLPTIKYETSEKNILLSNSQIIL